jgi:DNA-binding CsgD family transcriptional regulator
MLGNMGMNVDATRAALLAAADEAVTICQFGPAISTHINSLLPHDGYQLSGFDPVTGIKFPFSAEGGYQLSSYRRLAENEYVGRGGTGLLQDEGFGGELRIALTHRTTAFGELTLLREKGQAPFSAAENARAEELSVALGTAMRRFVSGKRLRPPKNLPSAPGVIVVGQDDRVLSATPEARLWLSRLVNNPDTASDEELFRFIWNTAYAARHGQQPYKEFAARMDPQEVGIDPRQPASITRHKLARGLIPAFGGWIGMHARPLDGDQPGQIAVVLEAPPGQILLPAVAAWYGLTRAERTIAENLRLGLPTKSIARRLACSPHTVNDHLKALFRKTGVTGREELLAALAP